MSRMHAEECEFCDYADDREFQGMPGRCHIHDVRREHVHGPHCITCQRCLDEVGVSGFTPCPPNRLCDEHDRAYLHEWAHEVRLEEMGEAL